MPDIARRLRITGRVQGVWFRGWMAGQAEELGVRGWVRNRRDGSVEALVEGGEEAVAELIRRCQDGPPAARVDHVAVEAAGAETAGAGFKQRPTA